MLNFYTSTVQLSPNVGEKMVMIHSILLRQSKALSQQNRMNHQHFLSIAYYFIRTREQCCRIARKFTCC